MCVLGRPFAIRQMVAQGQNVALMRDLTDVNRDGKMPPEGIDHFRGTDLVLEHIEKYWCPTITSTDFVGKPAFKFAEDKRSHVVFVIGEDEYETHRTLPDFAAAELDPRGVRSTFVMASKRDPNDFPGLEALDSADAMVVSVRRRLLPKSQLEQIRAYCQRGKPVIGIRTASHAFAQRAGDAAPDGHDAWPEFDRDVLGGNYTGHYGNKGDGDPSTFVLATANVSHPILAGVAREEFGVRSWLYKTSPLAKGTTLLMTGRVEGQKETHPVAWTHTYRGGKVFYTSLGHEEDFKLPAFRRMLTNAVIWALGRKL
jgi:type 1 glutamine amidotransferase